MKRLLVYLKNYRLQCILAPLFKMLEASFELIVPLVIAALIDKGIANNDKPFIYEMTAILFGLALIGMIAAITAQYFAAKAAIGFASGLRSALFKHLMGLSSSEIDTLGTSTMITRMTSDVNQTQNGVNMFLRLFLRSPFVVFGAMIMAFTIDVSEALIFVAVIMGLFLVVSFITYKNIPAIKKSQRRLDEVTRATRETLSGVRVLRAFRHERRQIAEFDTLSEELIHAQKHAGNISALMNPVTYVLINIAIVILIYTGVISVSHGILSQGQVIALYNYMSQILVELVKLANLVVILNKALASADRISDVFKITSSMEEGTLTENAAVDTDIAVEFDNVALRYATSSEDAVSGISFTARKGDTVGIIGGTGSGKSTLANLISRSVDATEGVIRIDGTDIKEYTYDLLRKKVGVVMQKAVLFGGTIEDNLKMNASDCTEDEMMKALSMAQATQVVQDKGGLKAIVEQEGRNFSGGQRQRISIARTLVSKPEIIVFDDSTSALDYATELAFRTALKELDGNVTTFIISQRTSSIRHADLILVMDDGQLIGSGTHDELLASCDVYREIHESQLGNKNDTEVQHD